MWLRQERNITRHILRAIKDTHIFQARATRTRLTNGRGNDLRTPDTRRCSTPECQLSHTLPRPRRTHAVRLSRRMAQGDDENGRIASHIAKHYMTQPRPVKANGRIAIIFNYVHGWGAEIDEHFWFQAPRETKVNMRHGPSQAVEQAIRRANSRHIIQQAEDKRKRIDGAAMTDWDTTMADISKHSKEDQLTLRAIMSAGLWD